MVVLHHHMLGAPWRAARKKPVSKRNEVLRALVAAGADLILAGHIHQAAVSERHEFEVVDGDVRAAVVSIAPGLGQPRPSRLGEARGLHVYEVGETTLTVVDAHLARRRLGAHRAARSSRAGSGCSTSRTWARERTLLHEAAVQIEQEDRAEQGEHEAAARADEDPRNEPADEGAGDPERRWSSGCSSDRGPAARAGPAHR